MSGSNSDTSPPFSNQHWIDVQGLTKYFHDPARGVVKAADHISFRCEPEIVFDHMIDILCYP